MTDSANRANESVYQLASEKLTAKSYDDAKDLFNSIADYKDADTLAKECDPEVQNNPSSIYSFLLVAGYLRCTEVIPQSDGNFMCRVSVPNTEISCVYAREIIAKLSPERGESTAAAVQQAIFVQDTDALEKSIGDYLRQTISVYDTGSEAFYQGLMIGLCAILNNRYNVRSNRESGLGRFDIQLYPVSKDLPGFIFELKASKKSGESLERIASDALRQIAEKEYESEMRAAGIQNIVSIGFAFRGKETAVKTAGFFSPFDENEENEEND